MLLYKGFILLNSAVIAEELFRRSVMTDSVLRTAQFANGRRKIHFDDKFGLGHLALIIVLLKFIKKLKKIQHNNILASTCTTKRRQHQQATTSYEPFHPMHNTQHKHTKKINKHPYMFHHHNTPINFINLTFQQPLNNLRSKLWGVACSGHTA